MIRYEERKRRPDGPLAGIRIRNAREFEPAVFYWVDYDRPVSVTLHYLTIHKEVEATVMPPGVDPDRKPVVVKRRKLCWPRIVDGKVVLHIAGIHSEHVVMVALRHMTATQLSRLLEITNLKVAALTAEIDTRAQAIALESMDAFTRMMDREHKGMTPEEAKEEVEAWGRHYDPYSGGGPGKENERRS